MEGENRLSVSTKDYKNSPVHSGLYEDSLEKEGVHKEHLKTKKKLNRVENDVHDLHNEKFAKRAFHSQEEYMDRGQEDITEEVDDIDDDIKKKKSKLKKLESKLNKSISMILEDTIVKGRGLPIGTINKYGEIKTPDGWKHIKKNERSEHHDTAIGHAQKTNSHVHPDHEHHPDTKTKKTVKKVQDLVGKEKETTKEKEYVEHLEGVRNDFHARGDKKNASKVQADIDKIVDKKKQPGETFTDSKDLPHFGPDKLKVGGKYQAKDPDTGEYSDIKVDSVKKDEAGQYQVKVFVQGQGEDSWYLDKDDDKMFTDGYGDENKEEKPVGMSKEKQKETQKLADEGKDHAAADNILDSWSTEENKETGKFEVKDPDGKTHAKYDSEAAANSLKTQMEGSDKSKKDAKASGGKPVRGAFKTQKQYETALKKFEKKSGDKKDGDKKSGPLKAGDKVKSPKMGITDGEVQEVKETKSGTEYVVRWNNGNNIIQLLADNVEPQDKEKKSEDKKAPQGDNLYQQLHNKYSEGIERLKSKKIKQLTDLVKVQRWEMEERDDYFDMKPEVKKKITKVFADERKLFKQYMGGDKSVMLPESTKEVKKSQNMNRALDSLGLTTDTIEKAYPIGYINKYGEMKIAEGKWKYVGKSGAKHPDVAHLSEGGHFKHPKVGESHHNHGHKIDSGHASDLPHPESDNIPKYEHPEDFQEPKKDKLSKTPATDAKNKKKEQEEFDKKTLQEQALPGSQVWKEMEARVDELEEQKRELIMEQDEEGGNPEYTQENVASIDEEIAELESKLGVGQEDKVDDVLSGEYDEENDKDSKRYDDVKEDLDAEEEVVTEEEDQDWGSPQPEKEETPQHIQEHEAGEHKREMQGLADDAHDFTTLSDKDKKSLKILANMDGKSPKEKIELVTSHYGVSTLHAISLLNDSSKMKSGATEIDGSGEKDSKGEKDSSVKEASNPKGFESIRSWSGDHIKDEHIQSIIEGLQEGEVDDKFLKLPASARVNQDVFADAITDKVDDLMGEFRSGLEHGDMNEEDIKDVMWGMIQSANSEDTKFFSKSSIVGRLRGVFKQFGV